MLLDTYAWVEFFTETKKGERVKILIAKERCYTSILSLAEITRWALNQNLNAKEFIKIIKNLSEIISLNNDIAILGGEISFARKKKIDGWGMIDSLILATALLYNIKVITGDKHFSDLENAVIL